MGQFARRVRYGIDDRDDVFAVLCRAIDFTVRIETRIAAIRRNGVMQISRRRTPIPQANDDVSLNSLWTWAALGQRRPDKFELKL